MTEQHPITPPPELVEQWRNLPEYASQLRAMSRVTITTEKLQDIATQAARWGADQQLLACGKYLEQCAAWEEEDVTEMYNYLRPKSPSLKEQALQAAQRFYAKGHENCTDEEVKDDFDTIRRALEALDD